MAEPNSPAEEKADAPTSESTRRNQRPPRQSQRPSQPLTHRLDLRGIRAALFEAGLLQPELERQRPVRTDRVDRAITRIKPTSASNSETTKENGLMHTEETTTTTKPGVGGTQQQHTSKVKYEISEGQKCLMYGGTAVVSGTILMVAWKLTTKWLG